MNRNVRTLLGLIVLGVVVSVAYWRHTSENNSGQLRDLVLYGTVDIHEVRLAFNGSEHVGEILVGEGDQVKSSQLLAHMRCH